MGSGRTELARILFGLDPAASGTIRLGGEPIQQFSTQKRIQRGMALLTESRRDDGLCAEASIQENLALVSSAKHAARWSGWLRWKNLKPGLESMRESVKLTPAAGLQQPVRTLSGGNQQKVVLGKWLLNNPKVFILDEPTRGIDVGAKYEIYRLIDRLAADGAGMLVISSELDELIGLCDRILVMSQGELRDELHREEFDRQRILHAALHADAGGGTT
jgi:ribose transport system ATP-binding protein